MEPLPVAALDAIAAAGCRCTHGDPFDRMLVAHAQRLDAVILSRDRTLHGYEADVLPA